MRSTVDLVELPYTFTQLRPLLADGFGREARQRGLFLPAATLEALHRERLLVPLFRVQRDGRAIRRLVREDRRLATQVAHWEPTNRRDIEAAAVSALFDPAGEPFVARRRLERTLFDRITYDSSVYLYSQHQLTMIPILERAIQYLGRGPRGGTLRFRGPSGVLDVLRQQSVHARETIVAVTALEPVHYPRVWGSARLPKVADFARFDRWRASLSGSRLIRWLEVSPDWLVQRAEHLLSQAEALNELGGFAKLVATAEPSRWQELRGSARTSVDLRIAAEILLRERERLAAKTRATPLEEPEPWSRSPLHFRLKQRESLEDLLYEYGLSPHPRLLLLVEGRTELELVPRVADQLGIILRDNFLRVQDAEGVDRDLAPIAAYVAPKLARESGPGYVALERPPTRLLIVRDPEGKAATPELRERARQALISRAMRTLPHELRVPAVRNQVAKLIEVRSWTTAGKSFEFAHFTDRQLAVAIDGLDTRPNKPALPQLIDSIANVRSAGGNLKKTVLKNVGTKPALADQLWPVLERKIELALSRDTHDRIPVVSILYQALTLAEEFNRGRYVLSLDR